MIGSAPCLLNSLAIQSKTKASVNSRSSRGIAGVTGDSSSEKSCYSRILTATTLDAALHGSIHRWHVRQDREQLRDNGTSAEDMSIWQGFADTELQSHLHHHEASLPLQLQAVCLRQSQL